MIAIPEVLNPQICLESRAFQDRLVREGAIVRYPRSLYRAALDLKPGVNNSYYSTIISSELACNAPYLVSNSRLASVMISGESVDRVYDTVRRVLTRFPKRIQGPEYLFHAKGLGWGLGVKEVRVSAYQMGLLYLLPVGEWISADWLSLRLLGLADTAAIAELGKNIRNFKATKIPLTNIDIETKYKHEWQLDKVRLVEL